MLINDRVITLVGFHLLRKITGERSINDVLSIIPRIPPPLFLTGYAVNLVN
ncbi:hypothetical protein PT300_04440 [Enterobacteriaceae bacterium ESL0689]|nr:hypothetical protein [Enterobacteriaceae bacterium ESL0689]